MSLHYPLMIPGVTGKFTTVTVHAPFDDVVIATLDAAREVDVDLALSTAQELFNHREQWLAIPERIRILTKTAELMTERAEELAIEAAREGGKPLIDSRVEVGRAIEGVLLCVECMRTDSGREIPMGMNTASQQRMAVTRKEPIGVVVAVSAFNHPLNLIVHQVGPAIASGCPVIVKPAEETPLSCYRFVSLLYEAGLPESWCQALVVSDLAVASKLVTDARVAFFSFIGSATVGWQLRSQLAPGTRCALEHGGVAPVIVEADADIDDALALLAKGGFYHAGQVCVSVQRIFCHHSIARDVADRLASIAQQLRLGDPTDENTEIGPLIRQREVTRVHEWVIQAVAEGAELLAGGEIQGNAYRATVLYEPAHESAVSCKEIFGPVICVYSFEHIDEALDLANALPFAFQAAVFTKNIDSALHAYQRFNASAVMVNDHTAFRVDWMPFAGLRQSGLGVGGIPYTYADMQIEKLLVIRSQKL